MADAARPRTRVRRWLTTRFDPTRDHARRAIRAAWSSVLVTAGVLLVVVPVGYATGADHVQVARAAGYGLVTAIGIVLRTHRSGRAWLGLLIGSVIGLFTVQLLGSLPATIQGPLNTLPSAMALTLAMIAGFGEGRVRGYRDSLRESSIVALMFTGLALVPGSGVLFFMPWLLLPSTAVIGGFFSLPTEGRRYAPPSTRLTVAVLVTVGVLSLAVAAEGGRSMLIAVPVVLAAVMVAPVAAFLGARAAAVWLRPRLLFYSQLAAYLRVMWVPIGSLAIGYLIIIVLFAGFYGMLARFSPGSFVNVGQETGIMTWVSFAFFTGVGGNYTGVVPVSPGARALVGAQLIPTIGWVLVMFAAVMAYLQPKLQQIARRNQP